MSQTFIHITADSQSENWSQINDICSGTETELDDEAVCVGTVQNRHSFERLLLHPIVVSLDKNKDKAVSSAKNELVDHQHKENFNLSSLWSM